MALAENLCELMDKESVSSYKLAKEIGVHISTITAWRSGKIPRIEHLQSLAQYFGVSMDALIKG